jgi:hypothetical protein
MTRRDSVKLRLATTACLLTGAALLAPGVASAQFTTFVAPPHKAVVDSTPHTVVAAKAKSDSVARMPLTDMKTWVDSAAGTSTQVAMASDTGTAAAASNVSVPAPTPTANGRNTTTSFSNGAIAPNTASPLPIYLATGLITLSAGLLLLRRRARARARV